ncbi:glycerophosphodiester phosphodiesterase family protein [Marinomonas sp.]|uniref:glycerophosphodiester phosphodiesterase family protein n=1 Tax=Marinomonas sp. TaxID=1904862 RepID=UPI003BA98258
MKRHERLNKLLAQATGYPLNIAHRGASGHCLQNTLSAFNYASQLGADMWELDVRLTADGVCIVSHDDSLLATAGIDAFISQLTYGELMQIELYNGEVVPTFEQVLALAQATDTGLYVELKDAGAGLKVLSVLSFTNFDAVCIGSFNPDWVKQLDEIGCEYPLSVLVRAGDCPFEQAKLAAADMIHLCWENALDTPHKLITEALLAQAASLQLPIVLWHEERASEMEHLLVLPVLGICTNLPEMISGYRPSPENPIDIVLHRGAACVSPENTMASTIIGLRSGAQVIELDVNTSLDGELMVIHDGTAQRTTDLTGEIQTLSSMDLTCCDAGSWFDARFVDQAVPLLRDILLLVKDAEKELYVELKVADVDQVITEVEQYYDLRHCFFWSFNSAYVDDIQQRYPQARVMRRRQDFASLEALVDHGKPSIVEYDYLRDDLTELTQCKKMGMEVMLRYPGKNISTWLELIALKPNRVNIDYPFAFAKAYRNWLQTEQIH